MPLNDQGINPAESPGLPGGNSPSFLPPLPGSTTPNAGSIPDNNSSVANANIVNDQLANLLEFSFDHNAFPLISFRENGSQDLAIHKYPNLDSAKLENTGRNPSIFAVRGIFTNNIYPSKNESWVSGTLFPSVFNQVLTSLYDTTTPIKNMTHPYLGTKSVMAQCWNYDFIGKSPRDGVFMDIVFIETLPQTSLASTIAPPNAVANLANTAGILDKLISGKGIPLQPQGMSLSSFFGQIASTVRNVMSAPDQIVNSLEAPIFQITTGINQVLSAPQFYQASTTQYVTSNGASNLVAYINAPANGNYSQHALDKVHRAAFSLNKAQHNNARQFLGASISFIIYLIQYYANINHVDTATIKLNLYLMLGQLQQIKFNLFKNSNKYSVQVYITQTPTTLMSLSNILNNKVNQLLSLNPQINKTLLIPAGTVVNYFQA